MPSRLGRRLSSLPGPFDRRVRFCERRDLQTKYEEFESYSPVVQWSTIHLVLILSIVHGLETRQVDYVNAFAQADLDKDDTGQCNEGVQALLDGYDSADGDEPSRLKHINLDINAITDDALVGRLVSRFVNINQLGDKGVEDFCDVLLAMESPPPIERFVLGSNGCSDAVLPKLSAT